MTSGHPGMQAGTPQSNTAQQMLGGLQSTLINAGAVALTGGLGIIAEGLGGAEIGGGVADEGSAAGMGGDAGGGLDTGGDPPVNTGAGDGGDTGAGGSGDDGAPDTWGDPDTLSQHYDDHGGDFGSTSPGEYGNLGSTFLQDSQANGYPTSIDSDGTIKVYDPNSNTFGAYNPNGTTKTIFKPGNGPGYWNGQQQLGNPPIILGGSGDPLEGFR